MLTKELIYSILDLAKAFSSDDAFYTEDHVLFLCKKYRSFLIQKEREKKGASSSALSEFDYQQICIDLEPTSSMGEDVCAGDTYLRSTMKIPKVMGGTTPVLYPIDYYQGSYITYTSRDRMRYTGSNPYLKNVIYSSLGPDQHLYVKSTNPQFLYLKKLRMSAIFEDFELASDYQCDDAGNTSPCDVLDADFPMSEYLVPSLIELVVKELVGASYRPTDSSNNANDDLSTLANYIRRNMKSGLQKQIEG